MAAGALACRDLVDTFRESEYPHRKHMIAAYDAHVFYGLEGHLPALFADALERSTVVCVDLGYWNRREGGRYLGYHKVVVNARHPTAYYRKPAHPPDRLKRLGLKIEPWKRPNPNGAILLAGMGAKGAAAEGYYPQQWERAAVDALKAVTDRPIWYRPKPNDPLAAPIPGTSYAGKDRPLEADLAGAWAVVTHHSNVAVDALLAGIPVFCFGGVARDMGLQDFRLIEAPIYPDGRDQWAADVAYTQWTVPEMQSGACWAHLKQEGLV
jgi:hypothetical protein